MKPNKEYLDMIAKKLGALRAIDGTPNNAGGNNINQYEPKMPSLMDQMGITAKKYLDDQKNKRDNQ